MMDYPLLVFAVSFAVLWLSARAGTYFRRRHPRMDEPHLQDLGVIVSAALTLLALVIGFSFSMAIARYDLRKSYEATEANAIGTDYVRVDFLPAADATKLRELLRSYLDQRVLFYTIRSARQLEQINTSTAQLQTEMWSIVRATAPSLPGPLAGLSVSGMNDVLNSQAYAQAAWWNQIPSGAWVLAAVTAICCTFLFVYSAHSYGAKSKHFSMLPLIISIAFFLIADIDSPRGGVIRVRPQNLEALAQSLRPRENIGFAHNPRSQ